MSYRDQDSNSIRSPAEIAAYSDLFDRIRDSVMILDNSTHVILDINPSGIHLFGKPKEKIVGRALLQWLEASAREDFVHAVRISARRAEWHRFDSVLTLCEGRRVTMEMSAACLRLRDQREVIQLVGRDVSERRGQEQAIQLLKQEISALKTQGSIDTSVSIPRLAKTGS